MSFMTKPRDQWTDADITADLLAKAVERRAEQLHALADRIAARASQIREAGAGRPRSAIRVIEDISMEVAATVNSMSIPGMFVEAADVDARYAAEKRAAERGAS